MKLDWCKIPYSVSPAIIKVQLGNFPEQVGKTAVAFVNAVPSYAHALGEDGISSNQQMIVKSSNERMVVDDGNIGNSSRMIGNTEAMIENRA